MTAHRGFRLPPFTPRASRNRLLVVLRDRRGVVGHVVMGSALLHADWDAGVSMLPSGGEAEGLADFFCDTPTQAKRAMDELANLGDVPFHLGTLRRGGSPHEAARRPSSGSSGGGMTGRHVGC